MSLSFCACSNKKGFWKSHVGIAIKWIPIIILIIAGVVASYFILCLMGIAGSKVFYPGSNVYSGCRNGKDTCGNYRSNRLKCYFDNGGSFYGMCLLEGFVNTVCCLLYTSPSPRDRS